MGLFCCILASAPIAGLFDNWQLRNPQITARILRAVTYTPAGFPAVGEEQRSYAAVHEWIQLANASASDNEYTPCDL